MLVFDHLYFVIVFFLYPIWSVYSWRKMFDETEDDPIVDRPAEYRWTMMIQWSLALLLGGLWFWNGRDIELLTLKGMDPAIGVYVGISLFVLTGAALLASLRHVHRSDEEALASMRGELGEERCVVPRTLKEYKLFVGLSFTAGFVEELIWRGFVFWYLGQLMPLWAVVAISSLSFGVAHLYQGWTGVVKVIGLGVFFSLAYVLTGVLWFAVVLHIMIDVLQGATLLHLFRDEGETAPASA